jgi:hypothetical protein
LILLLPEQPSGFIRDARTFNLARRQSQSTYSNTSEAPAAHIPTDAHHKPNDEEKSPTSSQYARVGALVTTRKFVGTTPRISR